MASVVKRPAPIPRWFWFASLLGCTPGFKRSRCKKLLKVTISRIKLLRGRREVQVRQLRRDIAQILQLGQAENAESRLDRLWKEQSLLSAYTKIGDYCQLVKANLSNIALPRDCPVDLKEPIASLCFAASCCADLPELQEFREIMIFKYGKNIVSAQELFPGKHVNKMFLEAFATKEQSEVSRKALLKGLLKEYNVVQPTKPMCPSSHDSQQSKVANVPYTDFNQQHSRPSLEKEEKHPSARQTLSRTVDHGLNGERISKREAKKLGHHKQDPKNVQLEEGTAANAYDMFLTKSLHDKRGRGRNRLMDHKKHTGADQAGEGDLHLSSSVKPNNKRLEPECAVINERQVYREGPLPGEDMKGRPKSRGKVLDDEVRSEREVIDFARAQHECGVAPPFRGAYEQIFGGEKPTYGKTVDRVFSRRQHQKPSNESLSQGFRGHYMKPEGNVYDEEENHVERDVYSQSNGYPRSKRVMHDFETCKKGMPHTECVELHSKSETRSRPAGECDNDMLKVTSFYSHPKQKGEFRTGYEFENQQPFWENNGALPPEQKDRQKVRQDRKHSSKKYLPNEIAEMETLPGAYADAHMPQKVRKKPVNKHHSADTQQEIGTDFLPDQAAKVSPRLHKRYEDYEYQWKEAARQAEAGAKHEISSIYNETRSHEPAVGHGIDGGHVPENSAIHARQGISRRTKKHSLRSRKNEDSIDEEPLQQMLAEEIVNGKASLRSGLNGSSLFENERTQTERGHFLESIVGRGPERVAYAAETKNAHHGYGFDQVSGLKLDKQPEKLGFDQVSYAAETKNGHHGYGFDRGSGVQQVNKQPENSKDHEGTEFKERISELEKGSLLSSRFSKPPDRPPPPVPPYRVSSLPSRQPLSSPPIMPQRSVTLETSHVRGTQEPHVHPKLPDYEDLVASFAALRNKPNSSPSS